MHKAENEIASALVLDWAAEATRIAEFLKEHVVNDFKKRGVVVALSGGIDSSACLGLSVRAFGAKNVLGLLMPERHSSDSTLGLSQKVADAFGVETIHHDLTNVLESFGCYQQQDEAIKRVIPEFDKDWRFKIIIPNVIDEGSFRIYSLVAEGPNGEVVKKRLPTKEYLQIVAATNFKQRTRRVYDYFHADRLNYAVVGTPNRLEFDQGFFVKLGDGISDIKPIAHLYKTQVYALAAELGVPEDILRRPPTTDTYSLSQGQDEFYFSLPYDKMDICLYGLNNDLPKQKVADEAGVTVEQLERVYRDIEQKRRTTRYLHINNVIIDPELEVR